MKQIGLSSYQAICHEDCYQRMMQQYSEEARYDEYITEVSEWLAEVEDDDDKIEAFFDHYDGADFLYEGDKELIQDHYREFIE